SFPPLDRHRRARSASVTATTSPWCPSSRHRPRPAAATERRRSSRGPKDMLAAPARLASPPGPRELGGTGPAGRVCVRVFCHFPRKSAFIAAICGLPAASRGSHLLDPARPTTFVPAGPNRRRFEFMIMPGDDAGLLDTDAGAWALLQRSLIAESVEAALRRAHAPAHHRTEIAPPCRTITRL